MRASGRMAIIAIGVFILVVVIFGRALARFYVDMLWYDGLGQSGVFWGALRARLLLFTLFFALFAVLSGTNLAIADKLAPTRFHRNAHPVVQRFHETFGRRLRVYRYAVAAVFAFLLALPTTTQWQSWLLFRNRQSFDVADAAVRGRHRFLRVRAAVPQLRARLAVLRDGHRAAAHRHQSHPERRRDVRLADPDDQPGRPRAPRRDPRRPGCAQGRRLLDPPLRDDERASRLRAGRYVLGRERAAPGAAAPRVRRDRDGRSLPVDAQDAVVEASARGLGGVGRARDRGRVHLPGRGAGPRGQRQPAVPRGRVHRAQCRRDPSRRWG